MKRHVLSQRQRSTVEGEAIGAESRGWSLMTGQMSMVNDSALIVLTDALVEHGLADLRQQLRRLALSGARVIVVDVASMGELSSEMVAILLGIHRICRARGGGLVLRNPSRRTSELLQRTGLSRVLLRESA
jgi:anti-sigma B factor antagonist